MVRGGLGAIARSASCHCRGCRRSSTASASRISPTSISDCRREVSRASSAQSTGSRSEQPDLVCVTGDLLSRPRAERQLLALLAKLPHPFVVLGNHDYAISRDPFSRPVELGRLEHGTCCSTRPSSMRSAGSASSWPESIRAPGWWRSEPASSRSPRPICTSCFVTSRALSTSSGGPLGPDPGRTSACRPDRAAVRLRQAAAGTSGRAVHGRRLRAGGTVMHVSPGLGTTFVPFRFFARPEATELVLRSGY